MTSYITSASNYMSEKTKTLKEKLFIQDPITKKVNQEYEKLNNTCIRLLAQESNTYSLKNIKSLQKKTKELYDLASLHTISKKLPLIMHGLYYKISVSFSLAMLFSFPQSSIPSLLQGTCVLVNLGSLIKDLSTTEGFFKMCLLKENINELIKKENYLATRIRLRIRLKKLETKITSISKIINSNIKKHQLAKIASISTFALSLIALISSVSIFISFSFLSVGLISAAATKYFSKTIIKDHQSILKTQKDAHLNLNYKLFSNNFFYLECKKAR